MLIIEDKTQPKHKRNEKMYIMKFTSIILIALFFGNAQASESSKNLTVQRLIDSNPVGKQLQHVQRILKITPIRIDDFGQGKEVSYNIQNCNIIFYTDNNKNIEHYEIPISNKCPFSVDVADVRFNSKSSSLGDLLKSFLYPSFSADYCADLCGNAIEYYNFNYLTLEGSRSFPAKFIFTFPESPGIDKWKSILADELIKSKEFNTSKEFWEKNSFKNTFKYSDLAMKYWERNLKPISISIFY